MSQIMGHYMRLEQKLTPQLIQSMDILQLSTADLEKRIAEELEKNVTLEVGGEKSAPEASAPPTVEERVGEDAAGFNRLDKLSREYDLDTNERIRPRPSGRLAPATDRDAKLDAMANTASRPEGLDEHLLAQWSLLDLDDETRRAGEAVIYHLEDDGYLKVALDRIAADMRPPSTAETVERALANVQRLDPVGIAARDYKECLLLQLDALPGDNTIERVLIQDHLDDIGRNRYPAVAKATGFTVGEITAAVDAIKHSLVLHPGHTVVDKRVPRVYPDVVIEEDLNGKGLVVKLVRGNLPEIRVKQEFLDMLRTRTNGKDVRDFVRKQIESAGSLVEAVKFRKGRLLEVARAVVTHQPEFFRIGPPGLKVFRMSDLAEELGCDPSTISRAVADKYVETPHGVLPLRYFFTGGTDTGNGDAAGWDSVKTRVAAIIKDEDSSNPLNDDQIVAALDNENIHIKRRTVAKYRAQLNIPTARQRKKF